MSEPVRMVPIEEALRRAEAVVMSHWDMREWGGPDHGPGWDRARSKLKRLRTLAASGVTTVPVEDEK